MKNRKTATKGGAKRNPRSLLGRSSLPICRIEIRIENVFEDSESPCEGETVMARGTERSKALDDSTFPWHLRWGNQRLLRCSNTQITDGDSGHRNIQQRRTIRDSSSVPDPTPAPLILADRRADAEEDITLAAMRENAVSIIQAAARKSDNAIGLAEGETSIPPQPAAASTEVQPNQPWSLRTRRAACRRTAVVDGVSADGRINKLAAAEQRRAKFTGTLSKKEIEEDIFSMIGRRPQRRPKKRSRALQKQIENIIPGFWLTEVTADMYKVSVSAPPPP